MLEKWNHTVTVGGDVFGPTVNLASRLETHSEPGRIQVSRAAQDRLAEEFDLEPRGPVPLKGFGSVPTWFLLGRRSATARSPPLSCLGATAP